MSEDTKNENNEEVEETSEDVETEEEVEESADSEATEETEESSDDDAAEDDSDEEDASDEDDADEEEASDEDDSDEEEASDEDDSDEEEASDEDDADEEEASDEDDSDEEEASDEDDSAEEEASDEDDSDEEEASDEDDSDEQEEVEVATDDLDVEDGEEDPHVGLLTGDSVEGVAAFFDHPDHLLYAAIQTRDSEYDAFDAYSPFPIHGMDDALGLGRSWIPWVTFGAGCAGFSTAVGLQFGIMGFDWPMNFGGKPFIAWPSFVPIMFELTVLFAGVITGLVMLKAAGCFQKPFIIDPEITNDRFVLWISATDDNFDRDGVIEFMKELNPSEIRTIKKDA